MLKRIISLTLCVCMLWSSTVLVAGAEGLVDGENAAQAADDAPLCDKCSASLDENGAVVHAADCPNAPKTEEPPADSGPKVGDQIWIKRGVDIYKDYTNESETPHNTKAAYQITIEEVILGTDNVPAWYRFSFAGLSGIIGSVFLRGYQYVRVENTSVEEPTEPTEPPVTPGHEVTTEKGDTVTAEGLPETAVLAAGEPAQEAMTALRGFAAEQEEPFGKALRERNRKVGGKSRRRSEETKHNGCHAYSGKNRYNILSRIYL